MPPAALFLLGLGLPNLHLFTRTFDFMYYLTAAGIKYLHAVFIIGDCHPCAPFSDIRDLSHL